MLSSCFRFITGFFVNLPRPLPGSPWEYIFYLDFDGDIRQEVTKKAIAHLKEIAKFFKFLGSYPKGYEVTGQIQERRDL